MTWPRFSRFGGDFHDLAKMFTIWPRFSVCRDVHDLAEIFTIWPRFSPFGQDFQYAEIFTIWPRLSRFGQDFPDRPTEFSNGRKIARIAPILTKIGQDRSQRRELSFLKFSRRRRDEQTNERTNERGVGNCVVDSVVES